jgi:tetratricopeptide (TPR) repeat protein
MPTVAAKPAGDVIAERLGILDRDPQSLITSALKPGTNNIKWAPDMAKAFPDLKAAETQLGRPVKTFADAKEAATIAKENLWNQYTQKLEQARAVDAGPLQMRNPQTGQLQAVTHEPTIDGNQVADAMEAAIDKRTAAQNPALVDRIEAVAKTYRRPMKLDEAEEFLQSANNELNSYYAKNKVGQQVAARDPETGHVVAEASALRQALYSKLDELTGPGAAELKQRYGAISNFQDVLLHRENVALRQQPVSLAEQISKARAYGKIAVGVARGDPWSVYEGVQQSTAATWLKERQTSEAMMERAFANYGRPGVSGPTAAVAPRIPTAGVAVRAGAGSLPVGSDYENVAP